MKNTKQGFKLTSPFKLKNGPGDEKKNQNSSTEKKSFDARSEGLIGKATVTKVKEVGARQTVAVQEPKKFVKDKTTPKNLEAYKNMTPAQKKAADDKERAKNKGKKAKIAADNAKITPAPSSEASSGTLDKTEFTPTLTKEVEGTTSDTFTPEETRMQNRENKIDKRMERQTGKQTLRRNKRSMKNSADWDSMTSEERKAAAYELKKGQTKAQKDSGAKSALEKFGKDFQSSTEKARQMGQGQGELNQMEVKQQNERPGEATTTKGAQYLENKNTEFSSKTNNLSKVQKAEKGGETISDKGYESRPEVTVGESRSSDSVKAVGQMKSSALKFVMKGFGSKAGFNFNKKK